MQTGSFTSHSNVVTLSWNLEGTRLLTGGTNIQLWKSKSPTHQQEEEHTGKPTVAQHPISMCLCVATYRFAWAEMNHKCKLLAMGFCFLRFVMSSVGCFRFPFSYFMELL